MKKISHLSHALTPLRALTFAALVGACSATSTGTEGVGTMDAGDVIDTSTDHSEVSDRASDREQMRDVLSERADADLSPRIELFTATQASHEVAPAQIVGLYARVRAGEGDGAEPLFGREVRLQMDGGDGEKDTVVGGYSAAMGSDTVIMDRVCVDTSGNAVVDGATLVRTTGAWGRVTVQSAFCSGTQRDTGWLVARLYAPATTRPEGQRLIVTATDLSSGRTPAQATVEVHVVENPSAPYVGLVGEAITGRVRLGQTFATMFVALNNTTPIPCNAADVPMSTNGESAEESRCNSIMNGPASEWWRSVTAKNIPTYASGAALSIVEGATRGALLLARGIGTDMRHHWVLTNLGGGMHLVIAQANSVSGRAEITANLHAGTDTINSTVFVRVE